MPEKHFTASFEPEIEEFGDVIQHALAAAGGFELVRRSESDPHVPLDVIEPILDQLGVLDLVPHQGEDQLQAAAIACRAAGKFALPYPVAERLAGTSPAIPTGTISGGRPRALAVVTDGSGSAGPARTGMGRLEFEWWSVAAPTGSIARATSRSLTKQGRLGPFVADLDSGESEGSDITALALGLNLQSFTLLGMLDSALRLTIGHTNDRVQFGAPIVSYQAVQHRLADALIALESFEGQAHYALWSIGQDRPSQLVDVVGARLAGLEAADIVLRTGHQLHGATGFCDETSLSWLSRHSQPLRRLPLDRARTDQWFVDLVLQQGFDGLFPMLPPVREKSAPDDVDEMLSQFAVPISGAKA